MTKRCTRCKKDRPIEDFRFRARQRDGRVATCNRCEIQLGRPGGKGRRCLCGTILRASNPKDVCSRCDEALVDARHGKLSGILGLNEDLRKRLGLFTDLVDRLAHTYRSIADRPSPEDYLAAVTDDLDEACALAGLEPPEIEDVFPRAFVELVTGESIGIVVSEGVGDRGGFVCGEVHEDAPRPTPSDLSEASV